MSHHQSRAIATLPILPPAAMVGLPEITQWDLSPAGHPPRLYRMRGEAMAPTVRNGDFLLAVPVNAYHCEGLYLLSFGQDHISLYRCESQGRDRIRAWKDNKALGAEKLTLTRAEFEDAVLAQVAMTARLLAGGLLPEANVEGAVA